MNHSGIWECVNTHMKSKVVYRTAFIKLRVLPSGAKFDPMRFKSLLTSLILVCGISFLICLYNILIASLTSTLSKRNFVLRGDVRKMNKKHKKARIKSFREKETTSVTNPLPHLLHRRPTAQ